MKHPLLLPNVGFKSNYNTFLLSMLHRRKREDFVLATKGRFQMDSNNPNSGGLSRKNITWSVEESLKRLKTDYIDLYQVRCYLNLLLLFKKKNFR